MKKKLIIIGAGGHGHVIADIAAEMNTYNEIAFLDDNGGVGALYPVLGGVDTAEGYIDGYDFAVGIGNAEVRRRITLNLKAKGASVATLIHPAATVSRSAHIGEGGVVMAGAVINARAVLGEGVIVNTCASVDHDCIVGDYTHISVGAHLCGTVQIGDGTWIGAGATVSNNVNICGGCMIGAGAVVVKDIDISGTYIGVPAEKKICSHC